MKISLETNEQLWANPATASRDGERTLRHGNGGNDTCRNAVFAHDGGGLSEVLNNESALCASNEGKRSERSSTAQNIDALRARLKSHARTFSTESFV